jgi:Uma2 family endonuclease
MISRTADYFDAINHLPTGATLVVHQFSWSDYERLLEELSDRRDLRVSYDRGKLEIMSPLPEHELFAKVIERVAYFIAEKLRLDIESYGIATWRKRTLSRGVEADACFYVANAKHIVGKSLRDLEADPPPDVVVEIDVTNESLSKFSIYAALGVPEIWRYEDNELQFFSLTSGRYSKIPESLSFPGLKPQMLSATLDISKVKGQTAALSSFRRRWNTVRH